MSTGAESNLFCKSCERWVDEQECVPVLRHDGRGGVDLLHDHPDNPNWPCGPVKFRARVVA